MLRGFYLQRRNFALATTVTTVTEEKRNRRKTINLQEKKSSCGGRKYIKYNNMLSLRNRGYRNSSKFNKA